MIKEENKSIVKEVKKKKLINLNSKAKNYL